jgi:hypothetical protein
MNNSGTSLKKFRNKCLNYVRKKQVELAFEIEINRLNAAVVFWQTEHSSRNRLINGTFFRMGVMLMWSSIVGVVQFILSIFVKDIDDGCKNLVMVMMGYNRVCQYCDTGQQHKEYGCRSLHFRCQFIFQRAKIHFFRQLQANGLIKNDKSHGKLISRAIAYVISNDFLL